MTTVAVDTAVLGSGSVAAAHALFQARHGPVVLAGRPATPQPSVERVPAAVLTLLLELGIVPPEIDVDGLTSQRLVAWDDPEPLERLGPACAHVERAMLTELLWRRVRACPDIHVVAPVRRRDDLGCGAWFEGPGWRATRLVDATGRRALTARFVVHPAAWVATCCTRPRGRCDPTMRLAAGADGYAFRLGSARWLTVGWVGPGPPPSNGSAVAERICAHRAGWICEDVDLRRARTVRRIANVAIPLRQGDARVVAIGDAALGRDALASQGAAIGLSDARIAAGPAHAHHDLAEALVNRHVDGLERHLRHLTEMVATCSHGHAPAWLDYRRWLENQRATTATQPASGRR